jgi:biopolymer transport protein TolR
MCHIDVSAFVGITLVVLCIFMSPTVDMPRPSVDLAKAGSPVAMRAADKENALVVAVNREGKVFFRTDPVSVEQLPAKIREGVSQGAERKVYIKADARAKYGWVKEVLDSVQSSGVEKIGFLVENRRTPIPDQ